MDPDLQSLLPAIEIHVHINDYDTGSNLVRGMITIQRVSEGMQCEKY